MANGAFKFKNNSGNVVSFISGSGADILFSGGTLDLSGMTGLTLGNLTLSGTTQNAISTSHAASYLLTSSFNSYSGTTNTVIGTLQTSTSSLNSYTSSNNTRLGVIESTTGSLNLYTSSNNTRLNTIESTTASLNTFTSSANSRLNSVEGKTGSYATTGSNQFNGNQTITGSLTVTSFIDVQELRTTYISSSILYRSGSTKFGDELTDTHAFTGSVLISGSLSVPASNLVSGSSQIDVLSTTNIARIATTGSNTFVGNQIVSGSFKVSGSIESSYDNLATEGGQLILRGPVNRYNVDNWSGNAIRLFREDDSTGANGNVIIFGSGSGQVGINKNGTNATLDVNGSALISGSLTTTNSVTAGNGFVVTGYPAASGNGMFIAYNSAGTNTGSIYSYNYNTSTYNPTVIDGSNVYLYNSGVSKLAVVGGYVGINKTIPNAQLDVNGNTIISGSLTTTGDININSNGIFIDRSSSGEPYVFFKKNGVNRGSIYGITGGGLRIFDQSDNQVLTMTSSFIGINNTTPSNVLDVRDSSTSSTSTSIIIGNKYPAGGGADYSGTTSIEFLGYGNYLGAAWRNAGKISSVRENNYSTDAQADSALVFYSAIDNVNTEKLRITSAGLIGVGDNSPQSGIYIAKYGSNWDGDSQYTKPTGNVFLSMGYAVSNADNWFGIRGNYGSSTGTANILLQANYRDIGSHAGHYITSTATGLGTSYFAIGKLETITSTGTPPNKIEQLMITRSSTVGIGGITPASQAGGALAGSTEIAGILRIQGVGGRYFTSGDGVEISKSGMYSYNRGTSSYNTFGINDTISIIGGGGMTTFTANDGIKLVNSVSQYRQIYHYNSNGGDLYFWNGTNQAYLGYAGVWTNASDISIKKDIINIKYGLSELLNLIPRSYKMKDGDMEQIGFIAQEVETIIPEVVTTDNKDMKGLSYGNLLAVAVKSIQEQQQVINNLTDRITILENK